MEPQDLSRAKEQAALQGWDSILPRIVAESEDMDSIDGPGFIMTPESFDDPQLMLAETDTDGTEPEESGEDPSFLEVQGEIQSDAQTGVLTKKAKAILRGDNEDFQILTERRVKIDLSFLSSSQEMSRTRDVILNVIKHCSGMPGFVKTKTKGTYIYDVANYIHSSDTDSSENEV